MRVTVSVIIVHLVLLAALLFSRSPKKTTPSMRPRANIRTVILKEPIQREKPIQTKQPSPKQKEKPIQTKQPSPKRKARNPQPKPKKASSQQKKLLSFVQKSLERLDSSESKTPTAQRTPVQIGKLTSEQITFETSFENQLVAHLEKLLELPERGAVTIKLTLDRSGKVEALIADSATSDENRLYIESMLPTLIFPEFGIHFKNEATHTFSITLTSEN